MNSKNIQRSRQQNARYPRKEKRRKPRRGEASSGQAWRGGNKIRSKFNTYKFQLAGSPFLLHQLIQLPIVNARGGQWRSAMDKLLQALEKHKLSKEYKKAVDASKKQAEKHKSEVVLTSAERPGCNSSAEQPA